MIQIIKLQDALKHYPGVPNQYDKFLLSTKTSGWSICKDYAASLWIKKISWLGNWETYLRVSNAAS